MNKTSQYTLKEHADIFKNIVIALGIIIGGSWTLYEFWKLDSIDKAKAELLDLKNNNFRQSVLQIDMTAKEDTLLDLKENYISGNIFIKNVGKKNTLIKLKDGYPPIKAIKVVLSDNGSVALTNKEYSQYPPKYAGYGIKAGDVENLPFFMKVGEPGLYYVSFKVALTEEQKDEFNLNINSEVAWSSASYVKVTNKVK